MSDPKPDLLLRQPWIAATRALTGDQRRVADTLLDLLEAEPALQLLADDGEVYAVTGAVRASQPQLAELAGVGRKVVRTALEALQAAGAVDVGVDGSNGAVIALVGAAWIRPWFSVTGPGRLARRMSAKHAGQAVSALIARIGCGIPTEPAHEGQGGGQANQGDRGQANQAATSVNHSSSGDGAADRGQAKTVDRGQANQASDRTLTTGYPQAAKASIMPGNGSAGHEFGDRQQLPLTGLRPATISDPGSAESPRSGSCPGDLGSPHSEACLREAKPNGNGATAKAPRPRKGGKRAAALAEIPVAADLADRFRQFVIRQQPGSVLAAVTDLEWSGSDQRLTWARQLAKLLARLAVGSEPEAANAMAIRRVLGWLVTDQGASEARYRIIVLSPSALLEKWDRILVRYQPIAAAPAPESVHPSALRTRAT